MSKKENTKNRAETKYQQPEQPNRRLVEAIVNELMQRHEAEFWNEYVETMKKHGRSVLE